MQSEVGPNGRSGRYGQEASLLKYRMGEKRQNWTCKYGRSKEQRIISEGDQEVPALTMMITFCLPGSVMITFNRESSL